MNIRLASLLLIPFLLAADWPHWRGEDRNDVSAESSGFEDGKWNFSPGWETQVDAGSSSPIVVEDRLYSFGYADRKEIVRCLNLQDGKEIWRQSYAAPEYGRHSTGDKRMYSGPSGTPEYDASAGLLFTLGVDGDLAAWNASDKGKPVWRLNLYEKYAVARRPDVGRNTLRDYGYTTAPLVFGDQLLVEVGAKVGNLISFDKRTGKELWKSQNKDEAGHCGGPAFINVEGQPCVAVLTMRNLVVSSLAKSTAGKTIGEYQWTTDFGNNIAAPAVHGDSVIITSAYNHFAMCKLQATLGGLKKQWEIEGQASGVCTPVIHEGHVYWAWRGVHCADWKNGEEQWVGGKAGSPGSCILTADDRLIVWTNRGDLSLVETATRSPKKFTQLASQRVFSRTDAWPHVVLAGGRLICKDRSGAMKCFVVK